MNVRGTRLTRTALFSSFYRAVLAAVLFLLSPATASAAVSVTPVAISALENAPFSGSVATFTSNDPGPQLAANYSATIDWGDSGTSAGTISGPVAGVFTITGSHTYADDGIFPVTLRVIDTVDSTVASVSATATVDEGLFTLIAGAAINKAVGQAFVGAVATFTDTGSTDLASEFTATIDWGDSTQSAGTISGSGGNYTVYGTHTYSAVLSGGFYSVTVSEPAAAFTIGPVGSPVTITAGAVTPPAVTPSPVTFSPVELTPFTGTVATFTTTDPSPVATNYTATIDWGDGTQSAGTIAGPSGGAFTVDGTHTYAEDGTYGVFVIVHDNLDLSDAATTSTANVTEGLFVLGAGPVIDIPEGTPFSGVVATFTDTGSPDPANAFTATIDWGDGTTSAGVISGSNGSFTVSGTHTYTDELSGAFYGVTVSEPSANFTIGPVGSLVTVTEADVLTGAPVNFTAQRSVPFSGPVATFSDTYTGSPASDFTASINWGDGSPVGAGVVSGGAGSFTVNGTHTYANTGVFTVTVTLADDAPGTATATVVSTATVVAPPTIAKSFLPATITAGGSTTLTFTLTNPATNTVALTGVAFTDVLPVGFGVSASSTSMCGGTLTTTLPGTIALSGATVAVAGQCQFSVNVIDGPIGGFINTTGNVTSTNGGTGSTASAGITVLPLPLIPTLSGWALALLATVLLLTALRTMRKREG